MTKILITGASGMVGKHLVDMCLDKGYYVRGTDIRYDYRYDNYSENFEYFNGDLRNFDICKQAVVGMDVVFHVAGVKGSPKRERQNNQTITLHQCYNSIPIWQKPQDFKELIGMFILLRLEFISQQKFSKKMMYGKLIQVKTINMQGG